MELEKCIVADSQPRALIFICPKLCFFRIPKYCHDSEK